MQDTREHMFMYIKTSNIFDIKDRISCGHDTSKWYCSSVKWKRCSLNRPTFYSSYSSTSSTIGIDELLIRWRRAFMHAWISYFLLLLFSLSLALLRFGAIVVNSYTHIQTRAVDRPIDDLLQWSIAHFHGLWRCIDTYTFLYILGKETYRSCSHLWHDKKKKTKKKENDGNRTNDKWKIWEKKKKNKRKKNHISVTTLKCYSTGRHHCRHRNGTKCENVFGPQQFYIK